MNFLRNAGFNFAGAMLPALALLITIPIILNRLGADAYGALVLITSVVGYFAIIDVNATAGAVKYVAEYHAQGRHEKVDEVISFSLWLYTGIGLAGGIGLWFGASALVGFFEIPVSWRAEAEQALRLSAFAFLLSQWQLCLQSIPQALHRFDISGQFDAVFGTLAPLATIAVVLGGGGLAAIVAARVLVSVVHCVLLVGAVRRLLPALKLRSPRRATVRAVSSFSAYAYLQRLAAVTHQNADKLLIGAQQSMAALTTYVVPYTLISRLYGMLYRLTQSVFPMASALAAGGRLAELRERYVYASRYTVYLSASVVLLFALFAQEVLFYWLGSRLDDAAPLILVLVGFSLFMESLTNIPSLVNDGLGRPHITGIAALLRVSIGVAAAWWAVSHYGVVALAASQAAVSVVMSIGFVVWVHAYSLPWRLKDVAVQVYLPGASVLVLGAVVVVWRIGSQPLPPGRFVPVALLVLLVLAALGWCWVLSAEHRVRLLGVLQRRLRRA